MSKTMIEPQAEYQVDAAPAVQFVRGRVHNCPVCDHPIGQEVIIEGRWLLKVGHWLGTYFSGFCAWCGERIYWASNDRKLERIVTGGRRIQATVDQQLAVVSQEIARMAEERLHHE